MGARTVRGLNPDHPNAYKNLAWLQATCPEERFRDGSDGVRNARRAIDLTQGKQTAWLEILAAAHAESGDFAAAVECQSKALEAAALPDRALALTRLDSYKAWRPWREPTAAA
jgi:hypothetical protein